MGGGTWTTSAYDSYMKTVKKTDARSITANTVNQFYDARRLDTALDPKGVKVRECRDSAEHPNTIPVILANDMTGSMGSANAAVARQLDKIITGLYEDVKDVEFMVMGIGDFAYDDAPLQVSQFESDVRICDQLGKLWFERGGGGNSYESYTAAWYFALNHTDLDCWKRGKKGIIITMGDEPLNPYLPGREFERVFGYSGQDIDTADLYKQVIEKYDVYHIIITDRGSCGRQYLDKNRASWGKLLDGQHLFERDSSELPEVIHDIVVAHANNEHTFVDNSNTVIYTEEGISW